MSTRRKVGDRVYIHPRDTVLKPWRSVVTIVEGSQSAPCFACADDPECKAWRGMLTDPEPRTGERFVVDGMTECNMHDDPLPAKGQVWVERPELASFKNRVRHVRVDQALTAEICYFECDPAGVRVHENRFFTMAPPTFDVKFKFVKEV